MKEETKAKISMSRRIMLLDDEKREHMNATHGWAGNKGMLGRKHSEETRKLQSKNRKGKATGKDHQYYGKSRDEYTKILISEGLQGRKNTAEQITKWKATPKKECKYCGKELHPVGMYNHIKHNHPRAHKWLIFVKKVKNIF